MSLSPHTIDQLILHGLYLSSCSLKGESSTWTSQTWHGLFYMFPWMLIEYRYVPLLLLMCVHCLQREEKNMFWSNLFNIFLELLAVSVLVPYGMHSSNTSNYNYVYMFNRGANLHNNLQTEPLYRNCISLYISKAVKLILFFKTCIQMYILSWFLPCN